MLNQKPTTGHLRCGTVVNNFKLDFDAIKYRKKKEAIALQISQKLDIVCWTESFLDFLSRILGDRDITFAHVVRTKDKNKN